MNINHMQRTLATKYQADASRMKKRLQHADSDTAAKRQSGDRVDISGEGLTALREKCLRQGESASLRISENSRPLTQEHLAWEMILKRFC